MSPMPDSVVVQSRTDEELLKKMTPEELLTLARMNAEDYRGHLKACRENEQKLQARIGKLKAELRDLKYKLETHVVEVHPNYVGTRFGRTPYATLDMMLEDPEKFCAFVRNCPADCRNLEPHEHIRSVQ